MIGMLLDWGYLLGVVLLAVAVGLLTATAWNLLCRLGDGLWWLVRRAGDLAWRRRRPALVRPVVAHQPYRVVRPAPLPNHRQVDAPTVLLPWDADRTELIPRQRGADRW